MKYTPFPAVSNQAKSTVRTDTALLFSIGLFVAALAFAGVYIYSRSTHRAPTLPCPADACVSITKDGAKPEIITIKSGQSVQFNSADGLRHNLTLVHSAAQHSDDAHYTSGVFARDEAWRVQFKKDGTYTFGDTFNPDMFINVVVYTPGKSYTVE